MSEENKSIVRRLFHELWNTGDLAAVDDLISPDCDGDLSYSLSRSFPFSAEDAFDAARSPSYGESGITARMKEFSRSHPELAKVVQKGLVLRHDSNFRGIVKSRARKFRESVPDIQCTIDEMVAEEEMVWVTWTLRGTFQGAESNHNQALVGKPVTVRGVSICIVHDGTIKDFRTQSATVDRWFESVLGIVPRP